MSAQRVTGMSETEREAICRAGFSTHDHLLQRDPTLAAVDRILASRDARLAAVEALANRWLAEVTERGPGDTILTGGAAEMILAALHCDPSEEDA